MNDRKYNIGALGVHRWYSFKVFSLAIF